jgi:bifunctional NMN adenylyltransferase/nudix hydrolase
MKIGFIIGRFQPLHPGHRDMIRQAKRFVDKIVIIVGSANSARTIKNPWTYSERKIEIDRFVSHENITATVVPLNDYLYSDNQWLTDARNIINEYSGNENFLIGHHKDGNDYLDWFPDIKYININTGIDINATTVREQMWMRNDPLMPTEVKEDFVYYRMTEPSLFSNYPYPDTLNFNCADCLVTCAGHVLLIERGRAPGRGSWALPGGFKNNNETFVDAAIRELMEETNLRVPEKVIRGSIVSTKLFDSPKRSFGISRITLAVHINIKPNSDGSLPRANGADDAAAAEWVPITKSINSYPMFDDHLSIISDMCKVMPIPANKFI